MARADKNNLHRSGMEDDRQQRQQEPVVDGAHGNEEQHTPEAAEVRALKRVGKTERNSHDDRPGA